MLQLDTEVKFVKGVGPRVAEWLLAKGITTVEDLLYYLPFRYEDRLNPRSIAELRPGETASIIAEVRGAALLRTRRMPIFEMTAGQGITSITCTWFHGGYLRDVFKPGQRVALYGRVEAHKKRRGLQMIQPQFEILGESDSSEEENSAPDNAAKTMEVGRIVPIYESAASQKLNSRWFRRTIYTALNNLAADIPDGIPPAIRARLKLLPRRQAFAQAHFPEVNESFAQLQAARTPAHLRLIFEELFFLQVGLELKRRRMRARTGISFNLDGSGQTASPGRVRNALKKILPFHPTAAQKRVLKEIARDMEDSAPMRRLLQGDVGSGKTIVALQAAVIAIENGYQVALMAPTEILATQHYLSARRLLENAGYRLALLTGSLAEDRKRGVRRHISAGDVQFVVGTHALIQDKVEFSRLGLVIVDEQHRFGVMQRLRLMKKTSEGEPDVLVMTATPIPRTLALTLYGDLDVSILDELPPGRTPITTTRVEDDQAGETWDLVRKQVAAGRQAYVVYPVIEGVSEDHPELEFPGAGPMETPSKPAPASDEAARSKAGLKAAMQMYEELRKKIFPDLRVGLIHGRLDADEKDRVMRGFQLGQLDILVATTVIEVGVDVPNASIMVIEHAERFGLSQLHQLRGRIGRGSARSYCVLMTGGKVSVEAEQRLDAMVRTQDGFAIAELDLELRGPGEFFGTRQAGMPGFRVANLLRDREILELARAEAAKLVAGIDPEISRQDVVVVMDHLKANWQRRYGLVEVG